MKSTDILVTLQEYRRKHPTKSISFEMEGELVAEVERLRYLLKKASGVELRGLASGFVFSQGGDPCAHKFRHEYANKAACGYRSRGPYQPLKEEDLTCPDCIDVIRAVGLAADAIERGEHRSEEDGK
jgi:hypothetical protein